MTVLMSAMWESAIVWKCGVAVELGPEGRKIAVQVTGDSIFIPCLLVSLAPIERLQYR